MAREDAKVAGCFVPAGQQRAIAFAAANRDPAVFVDPDQLDLARTPNPHVAFSAGAHHSLGAPLARVHAEIALPALFTRLRGLRPAGELAWAGSVPVRQVTALPVQWDDLDAGERLYGTSQ